jgi:hypothetical protein
MEHNTGLIEAIVFEIKDRDKIGGSTSVSSTALCCTHDLAEADGCKQGQIIIHNSDDQDWPRHKPIFFQGKNDVATMTPEIIPITKTGMYNLYLMFWDPVRQSNGEWHCARQKIQLKEVEVCDCEQCRPPDVYCLLAHLMNYFGHTSWRY